MRFLDSVHAFIAVSVLVMALLLAVGGQWVTLGAYYPPPGGGSAVLNYNISILAAELCVAIDAPAPPNVNYGPVGLNSSAVSPPIVARNCGNGPENFLINGADAIATVVPGESNWFLVAASNAPNDYGHDWSVLGAGPSGAFNSMSKTPSSFRGNVPAGVTDTFYTRVRTPTSSTGSGARNTTVTLTAVAP